MAVLPGCADERRKKRMGGQRLGLELRMELATQKPGVVGRFDDLDVDAVRRAAGDAQARRHERLFILAVKFVAVAEALASLWLTVRAMRHRAGFERARPAPQAHRAAHLIHP